jgi:RNase P/RNase MRP subunit POP5
MNSVLNDEVVIIPLRLSGRAKKCTQRFAYARRAENAVAARRLRELKLIVSL